MISKNICVFASSRDFLDKSYYIDAKIVGELLAHNDFNVVYGGSTLGMMFACANEAKQNGAKVYGVMPKKLHDFGIATTGCDDFFVADGMRARKAKMDELSDGVLVLAGGFGTLEEVSEMIVQKQLGYNNKPIVFLNTNGFYDKLFDFFEEIVSQNFANVKSKKLYFIANSPKQAVEYFVNYDYSIKPRTKEEIYNR